MYDEGEYTAKERRLVQDVQAEIAQGRRCIVYVDYSDEFKQDERLAKVLQDHGINAKVMKSTVDADERIDWMKQAVQEGVECVCLNVSLVEVGVDLLDFLTLIFYQQRKIHLFRIFDI
jgi:excinuclease UvrABC helicase subunit UvrB